MAQKKVQFQGLPARICWLGYRERNMFAEAINQMVASGELSAPIVIGRDHLDSGSVASPNRETEGMIDGSDAVADWPILNALLSTAGGSLDFSTSWRWSRNWIFNPCRCSDCSRRIRRCSIASKSCTYK